MKKKRPWTAVEISALFRALGAKHEAEGKCTPCTWYLPAEGELLPKQTYPWNGCIFPAEHIRTYKMQFPCAFSHIYRIVKAPFN